MWNIEKTVRVNPHAAAADSHSNKEKKRICWFWKRNCHDRPYSMSLTFRRPLYNVLVFLGSNDWRLFQRSQLSPRIWVPVFRPLRNSRFRWPTCLIQKDLLWHPPVEPQRASATFRCEHPQHVKCWNEGTSIRYMEELTPGSGRWPPLRTSWKLRSWSPKAGTQELCAPGRPWSSSNSRAAWDGQGNGGAKTCKCSPSKVTSFEIRCMMHVFLDSI